MGSRGQITALLNQLEKDLKDLEITYEQYFLGMEKRLPEQLRQKLALRMRKMVTLYIPQTDLRFRLQSITSRFNSYCGYWDRTQRLIDEGKYQRHTSRIQRSGYTPPAELAVDAKPSADPLDHLYKELVAAHQRCQLPPPNRDQVARFLARQEEVIKMRFGDNPVDFVVVTEDCKPKIKIRVKR
ncbi:MAG: MXAN_5187 C-terminal domain-containing protein [Desulfuromonadales bacterium]